MEKNNKRKRIRGWILSLSIPGLAFLWILSSLVFYVLGVPTELSLTTEPTLLMVIKSFVNRLLGMLGILCIPGMIVGIVLLATSKRKKIDTK